MLMIATFTMLVPAFYLVWVRANIPFTSIIAGVLTALVAILPLTIGTTILSSFFAPGGLILLFVMGFAEEAFRLLGLKALIQNKSNKTATFFDYLSFGFGFGLFEFLIRITSAILVDYKSCDLIAFSAQCSVDFRDYILIAMHAVILHVFLTALYFPLSKTKNNRQYFSLGAATVIHWSVNSLAIGLAISALENKTQTIIFPMLIAVYISVLWIVAMRKET